jgi:hypothetical protein
MEKINVSAATQEVLSGFLEAEKAEERKQFKVQDREMLDFKNYMVELSFHKENIRQIRTRLGKRCTLLVHEREPEYKDPKTGERYDSPKTAYFLKAHMVNETGGRDTVRFRLGVDPKSMNQDDYINLYQQLDSTSYVDRKES